jgi:recombination protein RecT
MTMNARRNNMTTITPQDEICQALTKAEPTFKMSLPPQIPSAKFIRIAQTAIRQNPDLANLDRQSLYAAFHKCAADGLLPDGREAAIVPFGKTATYMPMIQGICKKARNSGEIKTINSQVVYANDVYKHWLDEKGEHFKHTPARRDRGEVILVYAFAQTKDNGVFFEELSLDDLKAIEGQSRQKGGPWNGPFRTEMMRKSALRRLLKYRVPSSTDIDEVIRADDDMYDKPEPVPAKPAETTSSRLRDAVTTTAEPTPEQEGEELAVAAGEELPL